MYLCLYSELIYDYHTVGGRVETNLLPDVGPRWEQFSEKDEVNSWTTGGWRRP